MMKNAKAFCSTRFTLGQGKEVGRGGRIRTPRNLSIPIASSLFLHTVHSSVTALRMEAVIINHHSHTHTALQVGGKVLTKGLNRCCTPTHDHPEPWIDRFQKNISVWTSHRTFWADNLDLSHIWSKGGNIYGPSGLDFE